MKRVMKIAFIILGVIIGVILLLGVVLLWASKQPAVKEKYYEDVITNKVLEQKYTNMGEYEIGYIEYKVEDERIGRYGIWYPKEMEKSQDSYPCVVMANGTGVPASKYKAIFEHLASWGFIVIGNEDAGSWDGLSSARSLDHLLKLNEDKASIFYNKVYVENIGIAGHSQGGVGAINAVTNAENGAYYKAIYTASTTQFLLAKELKWPYDVSKIHIPYFMVAGDGKSDAETIAPLASLEENYNAIVSEALKVRARRVGTEHGNMLPYADGYMTAWFRYYLRNDDEAGKVFKGENPEILFNANWSDIEISTSMEY